MKTMTTKQRIMGVIEENSVTSPVGQVILTSRDAVLKGICDIFDEEVVGAQARMLADAKSRIDGKMDRMITGIREDYGLDHL